MGRLFNVPALPDYFLARPEILAELTAKVVRSHTTAVGITSGLKVGVQGMGGIGKSVLAVALAQDKKVRRAFPDGIYWLTLGQQPMLTLRQADLIEGVSGERVGITDVQQGRLRLEVALADKACLVLVDDVWRLSDVVAFDVLGPRSRLVFTTRHADIVRQLAGAIEQRVEQLSLEAALELLANASGCPRAALPEEIAREVARECGYLPLALTLAGKMIEGQPDMWPVVLDALQQADWEQLEADFPHYPFRHVFAAIEASVNALEPPEAARYRELAIFPDGVAVPEAALVVLWEPFQLSRLTVRKLMRRFTERGLATWDTQQRLTLHDLQRDFICKSAQNLLALHQRLLEAYRSRCPNGWGSGHNDGYFFQNLAYHLKQAGESEALAALLVDYHWIRAKIAAAGLAAVIRDYDWMPDHEELRLVQQALLLSGHILAADPKQLAGQLLGRLAPEDGAAVNALLGNALEAAMRPTLLPIRPTLNPPGSSLIRMFKGHKRPITAVAITLDGRMAISASEDRTIRLWDLDSGQECCCLMGHTDRVTTVAVIGDGKRALSGSDDRTLRLWDVQQGVELQTIGGHEGGITSLAMLPDGQRALSGSRDCTLRLWDLDRAEEARRFEGHQDWVTTVAALSEGQHFLSGSFDGTVRLWDGNTGRELDRFEGHQGRVGALATAPDGQHFVSADDQSLRLWNLETRHKVRNYVGHKARVTALAVTSDGRKLVSASEDRTLRLWDLKAGEELRCFNGHEGGVTTVALTPEREHAVSGSKDLTVALWDLWGTSGRRVPSLERTVSAITITPDEKHIVSASGDGTVRLWDLESGVEQARFEGHLRGIDDLAVCPDGRRVVSASYDKTLRVWDLIARSELQRLVGHEREVTAVAVTPCGNTAVSGSFDGTVRLWDLQRGCELRRFKGHEAGITAVTVTPNGQCAISASLDRSLRLWDLASGNECRRFAGHQDAVTAVAVTRDGRFAVSGSYDGTMRLWDISTGAELRRSQVYRNYIRDIDIAPDGGLVVSAYLDYALRVWDLKSFEAQATFQADQAITCCAVAWKRRWIAAGDRSGRIHVLEMAQ